MNKKGFTLVEVVIAAGVFLLATVGIIYSYLKCTELSDIGRNSSIAVQAVKNKMEEIKNSNFNTVFATYNNATFSVAPFNDVVPNRGTGVIYVNNTNPQLLQIKIVFCWRQPNGRIFGEDTNLNGVLNAGEDKNANGQIDSYVQIITNIYG